MKVGSILSKEVLETKIMNNNGQYTCLDSLINRKKQILVFVRHFNCFICRDQIVALNGKIKQMDNMYELSVVGCGQYQRINTMCDELKISDMKSNIYVDPDRHLYQKMGLIQASGFKQIGGDKASNEVTQGWRQIGAFCWSFWNMLRRGKQGDVYQLGGTFIVDQNAKLLFSHVDQSGQDIISSDEILNMSKTIQ